MPRTRPVLAPLLAQWDTSVAMLFERLNGLDGVEYRWRPTPDSVELIAHGSDVATVRDLFAARHQG